MRSLRAILLAVGLLPAAGLLVATGYGVVGPNTWQVEASSTTDVPADVLIDQVQDVRRWSDWLFIGEVGGSDFTTIEYPGMYTGMGAMIGWTRGFDMGRATLVSEQEGGGVYEVDFRERRAGRPSETELDPLNPDDNGEPTAWVETTGTVAIDGTEPRSQVRFTEQGVGGPRPLGPFLLGFVQGSRQELAEKRVEALIEVAQARQARRRLMTQ